MTPKRRWQHVAVAVAALCLTAATTTTAAASQARLSQPSNPYADGEPADALPPGVTAEEFKQDLAVDEFVEEVTAKFGTAVNPSADDSKMQILLSAAPSVLDEMKAAYQGRDVAGLKVDVEPAVVTQAAYDKAIQAISATSFVLNGSVTSFDLPVDSSAVVVKVADLATIGAAKRETLVSTLQALTGLPIRLTESTSFVNTSRSDAQAPWKGGAIMRHGSTNWHICSTGFSVLRGTNGFTLSAAHCDEHVTGDNWAWYDGALNDTITTGGAQVSLSGALLDSMLIDPVGGTTGLVFGGAWNEPSSTYRYQLSVAGSASTFLGDHLCTSGANSGEHCRLLVTDHDDVACGGAVCHRWIAASPDTNGVAVVGGDSGGPVYTNLGSDQVGARGIIMAGADTVTCGPTYTGQVLGQAPGCYNLVRFAGIGDVLSHWNATIETN